MRLQVSTYGRDVHTSTGSRHFLAYGGQHDEPEPEFSSVFASRDEAVHYLVRSLKLEEATRQTLDKRGYARLHRKIYGIEYCVVKACSCDNASSHNRPRR